MSDDMYVPKTQRGLFANGLGWVLAVLAVVVLVAVIVFGLRWVTAPAVGKLQARQQIQSGSYRIVAYNHFFDACASVQSLEGQIDAQIQELATSTGEDRDRVESNIAGLRGARAEAIADYNADAEKSYTLGQFRASGLPFHLASTPYDGKDHTSCTG